MQGTQEKELFFMFYPPQTSNGVGLHRKSELYYEKPHGSFFC
jgi:hypothetical protein